MAGSGLETHDIVKSREVRSCIKRGSLLPVPGFPISPPVWKHPQSLAGFLLTGRYGDPKLHQGNARAQGHIHPTPARLNHHTGASKRSRYLNIYFSTGPSPWLCAGTRNRRTWRPSCDTKLTPGVFSTYKVYLDVSAKRKLQRGHINMSNELIWWSSRYGFHRFAPSQSNWHSCWSAIASLVDTMSQINK